MKALFLIFVVLTFCFAAQAQKKMTDSGLENLNGGVESVFYDFKITYSSSEIENDLGKRIRFAESYYDMEGWLTQKLFPKFKSKLIYTEIDGFRTFKRSQIREVKQKNIAKTISMENEEPIEKPEIIVSPDERFTQRFAYEYDSQGRIIKKREY